MTGTDRPATRQGSWPKSRATQAVRKIIKDNRPMTCALANSLYEIKFQEIAVDSLRVQVPRPDLRVGRHPRLMPARQRPQRRGPRRQISGAASAREPKGRVACGGDGGSEPCQRDAAFSRKHR